MNEQGLRGALGLGRRAGQLFLGMDQVLEAMARFPGILVLMDEGLSAGTRKRLELACADQEVRLEVMPQGLLERAIDKKTSKIVAVRRGGFQDMVVKHLGSDDKQGATAHQAEDKG